jgi:hypothetical protein
MSDFSTVPLTQTALDPHKRVRYSTGLVLGVDEFNQEQLYLMEKDRTHNRLLHGYGTVSGLRVTVEVRSPSVGPEVIITPGMALDPRGREICVSLAQCAHLNAWLARQENTSGPGSLPDLRSVWVVLCYSECETDKVPVPGGPCRTREESMTPSRVADSFKLSLVFEPPQQKEEEAIRCLSALLEAITISDDPADYLDDEEQKDLVESLATQIEWPGLCEPDATGFASASMSPPDFGEDLRLHRDQATEILRAVTLAWVTRTRPEVVCGCGCGKPADGCGCSSPEDHPCVLIARIEFAVNESGEVDGEVTIDESERPFLLNTRLLQELLICGGAGRDRLDDFAGGDLTGRYPDPLIRPDAVTTVKIIDGAVTTAKLATNSVISSRLATNAVVTGKIDDGAVTLVKINSAGATNGQVIGFNGSTVLWVNLPVSGGGPPLGPAGGHLMGAYPNPMIAPGVVINDRLADNAVTTAKILDGSITTLKIADNSITAAKIVDGSITTLELASNAVTTVKIADNAVTGPKIADGSITATELADNVVTTAKLVDRSVTIAKINPPGSPRSMVLTSTDNDVSWKPLAYNVVAAGAFDSSGAPLRSPFGGLKMVHFNSMTGLYLLTFEGYDSRVYRAGGLDYIVKGTPLIPTRAGLVNEGQLLPDLRIEEEIIAATFEIIGFWDQGVLVRSIRMVAQPRVPSGVNFMIEISAYGRA